MPARCRHILSRCIRMCPCVCVVARASVCNRHTLAFMRASVHSCMGVFERASARARAREYTRACTSACKCVGVSVHLFVCVNMFKRERWGGRGGAEGDTDQPLGIVVLHKVDHREAPGVRETRRGSTAQKLVTKTRAPEKSRAAPGARDRDTGCLVRAGRPGYERAGPEAPGGKFEAVWCR